jgi:hypothetical protein
VELADRVHDASKDLPEYWNLNDTYYNWTSNVRGVSHVLTTVSDAPFTKTGDGPTIKALTGGTMGADHPVTWCKDYKGGRSYYTNHGASAAVTCAGGMLYCYGESSGKCVLAEASTPSGLRTSTTRFGLPPGLWLCWT